MMGCFQIQIMGNQLRLLSQFHPWGMHRLHIHHHITRFNGQLHPQVLLKILKVCHFDTEPSPICLTQQMRCRGSSIVDCVWLQLKNQILLMKHFLKIVGGGLWRWR